MLREHADMLQTSLQCVCFHLKKDVVYVVFFC